MDRRVGYLLSSRLVLEERVVFLSLTVVTFHGDFLLYKICRIYSIRISEFTYANCTSHTHHSLTSDVKAVNLPTALETFQYNNSVLSTWHTKHRPLSAIKMAYLKRKGTIHKYVRMNNTIAMKLSFIWVLSKKRSPWHNLHTI